MNARPDGGGCNCGRVRRLEFSDFAKHAMSTVKRSKNIPCVTPSAPWLVGWILLCLILTGCTGDAHKTLQPEYRPHGISFMGFSIQVGAFQNLDNAVRLTALLKNKGLDAYHFLHESGLYKVRIGNFANKADARAHAEHLKSEGSIDVYFIVTPEDYAVARRSTDHLRKALVRTAAKYIGTPYRWGGESAHAGFDCSGLTMVVYQENGLNLPRTSSQQWQSGKPVKRKYLQKGDLVFFATTGSGRVSHVGIYSGGNQFIHAPGKGSSIRYSSISEPYYRLHYLGARAYF